MSYLPKGSILDPAYTVPDRKTVDAFQRTRVAAPTSLFDSKLLYNAAPLIYDDQLVSGSGGASTYNANQSSVTLSVSASTAGKRVRQTFERFSYQPGHSTLVLCTGILGTPATGITRELGQFDDKNGLFFRSSPTAVNVVRKTYASGSAVDTVVAQSSWNIDKGDGTGASGISIDWSKTQIFVIQYQWLGVGSVWFGVDINGDMLWLHRMDHANSLTAVYMSTPNLPIRYSIENSGTGGAAGITQICNCVMSEGGSSSAGSKRHINRDTGLLTNNDLLYYPIIALRLGSSYIGTKITIDNVSVLDSSNNLFCFKLFLNPTITGTALSFSALTNSGIEYDISRTNATTVSGGTVLDGGMATNSSPATATPIDLGSLRLGSNIAGTSDIIVLAAQRLSGATATFFGSIVFQEY